MQKQERWASMTASLERELEAARDKDTRAEVLKRLGQVHRERHDLPRARELWNDALALKPQDASIYRSLAELSEREGNQGEVAETLRKQLRAAKEKVEKLNLLRKLASLYDEKLHDLEGVEWACDEILEQLPGDRDALRRLEAAFERGGEATEGKLVDILEQHAGAAATPAEKLPLLHRLAALYEKRGDAAAAADRLERAVRLDKNNLKAFEALARLEAAIEKWPEAAAAMERTLPKVPPGPEGVEPWKRYARIVDGKLGDPMRAARAWKEVIERRPTDKEALEGLSRLGRARGDFALLDDVLSRRQAHADGDEAVAVALERAQLADERLKNPERAIEILRHVLDELAPRNLEAHARLQRLLAASGNLDGSLRVAERELFLTEDAAQKLSIANDIARRTSQLKDARRAIAAWRRVSELAPESDEPLVALAALYRQVEDWEALCGIDEKRLELSEAAGTRAESIQLLRTLAAVAEEQARRRQARLRVPAAGARARRRRRGAARRRAQARRAPRAVGRDVRGLRHPARPRGAARGGQDRRREAARSEARVRGGALGARARRARRAPLARAGAAERAHARRGGAARGLRAADRARDGGAEAGALAQAGDGARGAAEGHRRRARRAVARVPLCARRQGAPRRGATAGGVDAPLGRRARRRGLSLPHGARVGAAGDRLRGGGDRRGEGQGSAARLPRLSARVPAGAEGRDHPRPLVAAGAHRRRHQGGAEGATVAARAGDVVGAAADAAHAWRRGRSTSSRPSRRASRRSRSRSTT